MRRGRHKRVHSNYEILFVSDNPNSAVGRIRISKFFLICLEIILSICIIGIIVFIGYSNYSMTVHMEREKQYSDKLSDTEDELKQIKLENEQLLQDNETLKVTINQKLANEKEIDEKSNPIGFPLSSAVNFEEEIEIADVDGVEEVRPKIIFYGSEGVTVIASGAGNIIEVAEDLEYGYQVQIDHGNGYISVYRCNCEPKVKKKDEVARGSIIYLMDRPVVEDEENAVEPIVMCYQLIKDGKYISPSKLLEING